MLHMGSPRISLKERSLGFQVNEMELITDPSLLCGCGMTDSDGPRTKIKKRDEHLGHVILVIFLYPVCHRIISREPRREYHGGCGSYSQLFLRYQGQPGTTLRLELS